MVITRKLEDGNCVIMIPNEGIQKAIENLKKKKKLDSFDIGMLEHFEAMNKYFEYVRDIVTDYIINNQKPNYYELIDSYYAVTVDDYIQCYVVKCNIYDGRILSNEISKIINKERNNFDKFVNEYINKEVNNE